LEIEFLDNLCGCRENYGIIIFLLFIPL
jgi:hypothetical protein